MVQGGPLGYKRVIRVLRVLAGSIGYNRVLYN